MVVFSINEEFARLGLSTQNPEIVDRRARSVIDQSKNTEISTVTRAKLRDLADMLRERAGQLRSRQLRETGLRREKEFVKKQQEAVTDFRKQIQREFEQERAKTEKFGKTFGQQVSQAAQKLKEQVDRARTTTIKTESQEDSISDTAKVLGIAGIGTILVNQFG